MGRRHPKEDGHEGAPPEKRADAAPEMSEAAAARRDVIVLAATAVFLRYGFKKTSMDDLARAAGISRQGLYLHFDTKEALFKAAILRMVDDLRAAWQAALTRPGASTEERIVGGFEALHGIAVGDVHASGNMNELLEAAKALVGPAVGELERELVVAVARLLTSAGVAAGWAEAGLSAKELAENLWAASSGFKHSAASLAAYRKSMRTAARIIARGART